MRLIDADIIKYFKSKIKDYDKDYAFSQEEVLNILERYEIKYAKSTVETIPKADYENRLKADLEAILTDLQLEIEELDSRAGYDGNGMPTFSTDYIRKKKVNELIQQKINALKGANNE